MARFALMSAATLAIAMIAGAGVCAPTVDLSAAANALASANAAFNAARAATVAKAASGGSVDATPIISAAALLTNAALGQPVGAVSTAANAALGAGEALAGAAPISPSALGATSGGASNVTLYGAVTAQTLEATNTGNTMTVGGSVTNGALSVQSNAFSGFSGIGNFVMNTGNQNSVQGSLNVTIVTVPGTVVH
ncbi:MAG TPA: hypothetical protein VMU93_11440 [Caulobacteraceae bacterium]|nr:hypothetical protein [Caulobacteraceae bacterium]